MAGQVTVPQETVEFCNEASVSSALISTPTPVAAVTPRPYFITGDPTSGSLRRTCLRDVPNLTSELLLKIGPSLAVKRRKTKVTFSIETFIILISSRDDLSESEKSEAFYRKIELAYFAQAELQRRRLKGVMCRMALCPMAELVGESDDWDADEDVGAWDELPSMFTIVEAEPPRAEQHVGGRPKWRRRARPACMVMLAGKHEPTHEPWH